jgi:hypothetical protein
VLTQPRRKEDAATRRHTPAARPCASAQRLVQAPRARSRQRRAQWWLAAGDSLRFCAQGFLARIAPPELRIITAYSSGKRRSR